MRALAMACCLFAACTSKPADRAEPEQDRVHLAKPQSEDALHAIDAELAKLGDGDGTQRGALLEKRGFALFGLGRKDEAAQAFDAAAVAYNQTPEATSMPVVRSALARRRADAIRRGEPIPQH